MIAVDHDAIIDRYIAMRNAKAKLKADYEAAAAKYTDGMEKIEKWFLKTMNENGQKSVATKSGTAYKTTTVTTSVADWDAVLNFIKQNNMWNMLNHAVNKTAVEEYRAANDDLPPGVNWREAVTVQIRKS